MSESNDPTKLTCLVTIHGIGFQEPPRPDQASGYADGLHANLARQLPGLSDDPLKQDWQTAPTVPIYICSRYPTTGGTRKEGLKRLGVWVDKFGAGTLNTKGAPLVSDGSTLAHVALVYAELEDIGPQPEAVAETFSRALVEHRHYGSILSSLHTVLVDGATAMFQHQEPTAPTAPSRSSLRPRTDAGTLRRHLPRLWASSREDQSEPGGIFGTLTQIEDDVCGYVCRNDLRERIRSFVREALLRLAARDDVTRIIVNSHSNGTVISFDTLRDLPGPALSKIDTFVTAGSPLRKYAELFAWGFDVGNIRLLKTWNNYFDPKDPVADPLAHPVGWMADSPTSMPLAHPFVSLLSDTTSPSTRAISDIQVNNIGDSSGGGLQAHNYWDNTKDFIPRLADLVQR